MLLFKPLCAAFAIALCLIGCHRSMPRIEVGKPRAVLGAPWRGQDSWFYPSENFALKQRGIAIVQRREKNAQDAIGTLWSNDAMIGAHQTLQLPALVWIRNLANGRTVRIALVDRGPDVAGRILAVSTLVARLLDVKSATFPVEILEDESPSITLYERLSPGPPQMLKAAPKGDVFTESLDGGQTTRIDVAPAFANQEADIVSLLTPKVEVRQRAADRISYRVVFARFSHRALALRLAARCTAQIGYDASAEANFPWVVSSGPFSTVLQADKALHVAFLCGANGAQIVVE